ncbi:DAHP synthetase I/KDSA [Desulfatibacillum aliphaticivorans]|uniref:DAHP synthetase I/KDSA n=1 Tax=Desulfatibacillum aliphaticivorans TaxID=218208 RepID=B8FAS4_DESAL|nr:DAHP synthetase [Desulfatibacillum aliphaticivorans]ACL03370.1 DAHP synthetase I/KDSA [Desulfatibacillum aliphaticivorans]
MKDISQADQENNIPLSTARNYERKIMAGDVQVGGKDLAIMAGPCTVESKTQIFEAAKAVSEAGAKMIRGGVYKPLTFPYGDPLGQPDADSGLPANERMRVVPRSEQDQAAEKRLGYMKEAAEKYGLAVISEIMYADTMDMMSQYVDMFQVGYRHMFNMDLVEALATSDKPILLKRHYGESLRSLLGVCEHFDARGKHDYAICERGVTVPHTHNVNSRAILDIQAIPAMAEYAPSVPVIIDPSHATFKRSYVAAMSRAAIAAGAHGLLIEVHPDPENAWIDPLQALGFSDFEKLMREIEAIHKIING